MTTTTLKSNWTAPGLKISISQAVKRIKRKGAIWYIGGRITRRVNGRFVSETALASAIARHSKASAAA